MLNSITSASPAEIAKQKQAQKSQNQVNSSYEYAPDWMFENSNAGKVGDNLQVSASSTDTNNTTPAETGDAFSDKCSDGEDDGRIGFGTALLQMAKGAGKSIVNTVVGIATDPKKALLAAGTIAACTLCPPLAVGLGAVGIATGVISGAKAVGKAVELYNDPNGTDAEAKAAFQDLGAAGLQVGVSVAGVKAGVKAMKSTTGSSMSRLKPSKQTGLKGAAENSKNTLKAFAEDTVSGGRGMTRVNGKLKINVENTGYKGTQIYTKVKTNIKNEGIIQGTKTTLTEAGNKITQTITAKTAQKEYNRYEKGSAETKAKMDADLKDYKSVSEAKTGLENAKTKVNDLTKQLTDAADDAKPGIQEQLKTARSELSTAKQDLANAQYKQAFENAKAAGPQPKQPGTFTKFAKDSGYSSSFGALTAPAAYELQKTNEVSNYDMVQLGKMNTTATGSQSRYTPGMYEFSHDWMDKI